MLEVLGLCHNIPVRLLDEEGRDGVGNEWLNPVCLYFSLYQGANMPVLSGASYRVMQRGVAAISKLRADYRNLAAPAFRSFKCA